MNEIVEQIRSTITQVGFLPIIIFVTFITVFVYWREARYTGKNDNSIFDSFVISIIFVIIWGRLTYLFTSPEGYDGLIWSIFPYERYPDGFYLFRLLPWRYFRIWDGEFLFTGLYIAFIYASFIYSTFVKRWRWREMMGAIISSSTIYLGGLLFFLGFISSDNGILTQSWILILSTILYFILARLLAKTLFKSNGRLWERLNYYLIFLYTIIVSMYIPTALLRSDITTWDRYNLYAFVFFTILSLPFYIIDVLRKEVSIKTKYRSRSVSISTNQPIKI